MTTAPPEETTTIRPPVGETAPALLQQREQAAGRGGEHAVELGVGDVVDRAEARDARTQHEHVGRPERGLGVDEQLPDLRRVGAVVDGDRGSGPAQAQGDRAADAAGAPGDDGALRAADVAYRPLRGTRDPVPVLTTVAAWRTGDADPVLHRVLDLLRSRPAVAADTVTSGGSRG